MAGKGSQAVTNILGDFGIQYPNAPKPSPAFLAFVRGLGMNLDASKDTKRTGIQQVKSRSADALSDLNRSSARGKENITADLLRRGVLRSGESNTRYARQAEDVAAKQSDIARSRTEGISAIENAYEQAKGAYRTQALERTLGQETDIANREASTAAQEQSYKRQEAAAEKAYQQQKASQDDYFKKQEELFKKYGAV